MKFITNFFKKREAKAKAEATQDLLNTLNDPKNYRNNRIEQLNKDSMGFTRKDAPKYSDSKASAIQPADAQAAVLALAYVEEAYKRMAGEPLPIGAKLIYTELLSDRPAKYELVRTPEIFHLGVISYFGLIATMYPERDIFGVIIESQPPSYYKDGHRYRLYKDHYGPNKIRLENYLSAFGISFKNFDTYIEECKKGKAFTRNDGKVLAIADESDFIKHTRGYKNRELFPLIRDNQESAKIKNFKDFF